MKKEALKAGDILHCRGKRWLARAIMKFTRSGWSHTAVVVECWGQIYIIDAQMNGVNARPYDEWVKQFGYDFEVSRSGTKVEAKEFCIKAFSKVGHTKYDIASLFWHQPLYILTGKWRGRTVGNAKDKMYCSEYVGWLLDFPKWWTLSPQDIYEITQNPGYDFKTIK